MRPDHERAFVLRTLRNDLRRLSPQEAAVLALLRQRLRAEERGRA